MTEKQLLSVVVPVYNNEKYLNECIESILRQTYAELEIILVDDGSTDRSGKICDDYEQKDSRIRVLRKDNEGACYARRDGILAAKGEYITFVDSDDWIDADMYDTLYGLLLEQKADIITSGFIRNESEEVSCDLLPEGVYEGEEKKELCGKMLFHKEYRTVGIMMSVCNKIYRRSLLVPCVKELPADIHLWEDLLYAYPPFIHAQRVVVTHQSFYHYRRNEESTSNRQNPFEYEQTMDTLDAARQIYRRYHKSVQEAFDLESCSILYRYLWRCAENKDRRYGTCREVKNKISNICRDPRFIVPEQRVIQQIPAEERRFLQLLWDGNAHRAIWYCRDRIQKKKMTDRAVKTARRLLGEERIRRIRKALQRERS